MFGIGMSEMIIICVVALLVFGPDELPQVVKKIARGVGEARRVTDDLRRSIDLVDDDEEDRRARAFARARGGDTPTPTASSPETSSGVTLAPTHGDDAASGAPAVVVPAGNISVGQDDVDGDAASTGDHGIDEGTRAPDAPTRPDPAPERGASAAAALPPDLSSTAER
jgi:sec-independent protein translocase protein TatB